MMSLQNSPDIAASTKRPPPPPPLFSSSNEGFFQELPTLENQYYDDVAFQRALHLFVPRPMVNESRDEISAIGRDVIAPKIFDWVTDAERNTPYLKGAGRNAFGVFQGELVVGEGWRNLQAFGQSRGFVAYAYDNRRGPFDRVLQFLRLHLWEASTANVTCPSAMQDGAARILLLHLRSPTLPATARKVFQNAFTHLTSRNPVTAWTSGQWMTERPGGSDVSQSETRATLLTGQPVGMASVNEDIPLGPWSISGFKWFSSATDSQMAILLAQTEKGLSAFYAPMRRCPPVPEIPSRAGVGAERARESPHFEERTELNGVRISRLKNKMGTKPLPTAELELEGMRAWLIGEEGKGIQEISTILTITRIHSAIASVGYLGRGLAIARAFAKVRAITVGVGAGGLRKTVPLVENALHMNTLANMTAEYQGFLLLVIYAAFILGLEEHPGSVAVATEANPLLATLAPPEAMVGSLLRVLTPITKGYVCKNAIPIIYGCMEALGGVGYLHNEESEYLNISRIYRDACVLAIWEGTTDVLASDFIRAMAHRKTGAASREAMDWVIRKTWGVVEDCWGVKWEPVEAWKEIRRELEGEITEGLLMAKGRELMFGVAEILISLLLKLAVVMEDTSASKDMFVRFLEVKRLVRVGAREELSAVEALGRDQTVVYGGVIDDQGELMMAAKL